MFYINGRLSTLIICILMATAAFPVVATASVSLNLNALDSMEQSDINLPEVVEPRNPDIDEVVIYRDENYAGPLVSDVEAEFFDGDERYLRKYIEPADEFPAFTSTFDDLETIDFENDNADTEEELDIDLIIDDNVFEQADIVTEKNPEKQVPQPPEEPGNVHVFNGLIVSDLMIISDAHITINGDLIVTSTGHLILIDVTLICKDVYIEDGGKFEIDPSIIIQTGKLYVSGLYTLDATILKMNCSFDGEFGIQVNASGTMNIINGSEVTAVNTNFEYWFDVKSGATFKMQNSELHEAGWSWPNSGLAISTNNAIVENNIFSNNYYAILLGTNADYNTIANNSFSYNYRGIYVYLKSENNTIINNSWTNHTESAIVLGYQSSYNLIDNNFCDDNGNDGIRLYSSCNNNIIVNNTVSRNQYGFFLFSSKNNILYHNNIIGNIIQYSDDSPANNDWHHPVLLEGNYWSDYLGADDGSGVFKHAIAGDAIGDTLIPHPAASMDNYPIMFESAWGRVKNINTNEGFLTIQAAINDANTLNGHTLEASAGLYTENVDVNKQLSIIGAGMEVTTVSALSSSDHVFDVTADNVKISGFTITGATNWYPSYSGIHVSYADYVNCSYNNITGNMNGIQMEYSGYGKIGNNTVVSNYFGIDLFVGDEYNTIEFNDVHSNTVYGIILWVNSDKNTVKHNNVVDNGRSGVTLGYSDRNSIDNNELSNNHFYGIEFQQTSENNTIIFNTITNNDYGIYLDHFSVNNGVHYNNINGDDNKYYGIRTVSNSPVNATHNWWGHPSGPYDPSDDRGTGGWYNPAGLGDNVTDYVEYEPWLGAPFNTLYVDDDYTGFEAGFGVTKFKVIQNAVDNASSGYNIFIYNGTYNENVIIYKSLTFYGDLVGASLGGDLVINNGGSLTLKGFTLMMNSTEMGEFGIYVNHGAAFYLTAIRGDTPSRINNGENAPGANTSAYYTFMVGAGSTFEMYDSEVKNAGFAENLPDFSWAGIWINTDNAVIQNSLIHHNHFHGLILYNSNGHQIINNEIQDNDRIGIWGINSQGNQIEDNDIISNGWDGIRLSNASGTVIIDNVVTSNGDDGIDVTAGTEIIDNEVDNSGDNGIIVSNSPGAIITGNTVTNSGDDGIYVQNSPNSIITDNIAMYNDVPVDVGTGLVVLYSDGTQIKGNTLEDNWRGAYIQNSTACIISNNYVVSNNMHGIQLYQAYDSTITNNTASSNGDTGIIVPAVLIITNNTANGNGDNGISISSSPDVNVHNNVVNNNGDDGLVVSSSDRCTIENISAVNNGDRGIILSSSPDSTLRNNTANNSGHGIHVSSSSGTVIDDNHANDCGDDGIFVTGSDNTVISNNSVKLNDVAFDRGTGIVVRFSSGVEIKYNEVNDNYDGMWIEESDDCTIFENDVISNSAHGIRVIQSDNPVITNHTDVRNNGGWGITVSGATTGATVTNNNADNNGGGIRVASSPGSTVRNNTANNNGGTGIYLLSSSLSTVTINEANSNWRGMYIRTSSTCTITENEVSSNTWYGIHLYYAHSNTLDDNTVEFNTGEWDSLGIYLSRSNSNTITNSRVNSNWHGIKLWYSYDSIITDNVVNSNNNFGINLEFSGKLITKPQIIDNTVFSNGGSGIALENSDYVIIDINTATFNSIGISLHSSDYVEITNNMADSNNYGIYLSSSSHNTIYKNSVERQAGKGLYGIYLKSHSNQNTIYRNSAKYNYFGISLVWWCTQNDVFENHVTSCVDYGAYLFRSSVNTLEHNEFNSSSSIGIFMEHSDSNDILSNNVTPTVNYGISLFESDLNKINYNNVTGSSDIGIDLSSSNDNEVIENIAEQCDVGISLKWSDNNDILDNDANEDNIGIYMLSSDSNDIIDNMVNDNNNVGIDLSISNLNDIIDNSVNNNDNYGIHLYSSNENDLINNSANNNGLGIYLDWSEDNTIDQNTATSNNLIGIALFWSSNGNTVTNNDANSNNNESIRVSYSEDNLVQSNQASGSIVGIHVDWSPNNNIVRDNTANNNIVGIVLEWFSDNNQVINNTVTQGTIGISVEWSSFNLIESNDFSDSNVSMFMEWYSNNNTVTNNIATQSEFGIYLDWYSDNNTISFNNASDNAQNGITLERANGNTLDNNTILNNPYGIYLSQASPTISSNDIFNPATIPKTNIGIYLEDNSDPGINNNNIKNTATAIYVGPTCSPTISGNTIVDDSTYGIYLMQASAVINGNHISLNTYAIYLYNSYAVISFNTITDNFCGVYNEQSSPIIDNNTISNHYYGIYNIDHSYPIIENNIFSNNVYDIYYNSREVVEDAISDLKAAKTGDPSIDAKLDDAIAHIQDALDNALWENETHLDPKVGNQFFDEIKKAINDLQSLINDKKVPASVKADCQKVIDKLVDSAKLLTENALLEAKAFAGFSNKVDQEISKAESELTKAENEITKGNPDLAVDHYKKSWEHSQSAIAFAN
jgi:parallel beta-helix repeat protein